jgi:surface polysaccharide O-acyltransferase-like enzyme
MKWALDASAGLAVTGERACEPPLALGEQVARDARTRLVAASGVVLVHAAYPPGHPALASLPEGWRALVSAVFTVLVSFPVNAFVLLSFLGLSPRVASGTPARELVRAAAHRLVPPYLFWSGVFLAGKAALTHRLPSPRVVAEAFVLGQAAQHLYFIPHLLALTLTAPLLWRLARWPHVALAGGASLAVASVALLRLAGSDAGVWVRSLIGFLGLAPFAVAGLALAQMWGGTAPPPLAARRLRVVAGTVALVSAAALVREVLAAGPGPFAFGEAAWLANFGCALAIPVLLASLGGRVPPRLLRLAPFTLGVYLVHPLFTLALRSAEARVGRLASMTGALIVPNALLTAALSVAAVAMLARTPARRTVI